jgi:ATP-binding cassette subfamily B protein
MDDLVDTQKLPRLKLQEQGIHACSPQPEQQPSRQQVHAQIDRPASSHRSRRTGRSASRLFRRRVPILTQLSEVECGAACLAMILCYYGRHTGITEIREQYGIGRDGLSARDLVNAARSYGLRVRSVSLHNSSLHSLRLPAIVHWDFNHFLVVEHWNPKHVDVIDPALGRRRLTTQEFDAGFTGVVLLLEPGTQFVRHAASAQTTVRSYIFHYMKQSPAILLQILAASLLLQVLGLSIPLVTKIVVDQVIPLNARELMPVLGVGLLFLLLAELVIMSLRSWLLTYLQARIDLQIMPSFFEHLLTLPLRFFQQRSSGDILTRVASNTTIRDLVSTHLIAALLDGSTVLVYFVLLLTQAPTYGILVFAIGVLQLLLLLCSAPALRARSLRTLEATGRTQGYVTEVLSGIVTLKAAGAEQRCFQQWSNLFVQQLNSSVRQNYLSEMIGNLMHLLSMLAPLALLWWGTVLALSGAMELGTMLALNALAVALLAPLESLVESGLQLQIVRAHLERISDVVEAEGEQDIQRAQHPPRLKGAIKLEHVNFRYDRQAPLVLEDLNVSIAPGEKVAIVGETGSGKTTLGKLLLGLYAPSEGEILYDSIPLRALNYQEMRMQFGAVMQEATIFSGSIRHNIAFYNPELTMEDIMSAARTAALHDDIMHMTMEYETLVAEGGRALSGGQRQRLALARALANTPAILLLDEATSSLDVKTERIIEQNLASLPCTQIIIAHRLSTIRHADTILVLDEGRIVERGTHQELMQRHSYYAELIQHQLASGEIRGSK